MKTQSGEKAVEDMIALPKDTQVSRSHESLTSIRTSIDEETLMELAKKGISAKTPVQKMIQRDEYKLRKSIDPSIKDKLLD